MAFRQNTTHTRPDERKAVGFRFRNSIPALVAVGVENFNKVGHYA